MHQPVSICTTYLGRIHGPPRPRGGVSSVLFVSGPAGESPRRAWRNVFTRAPFDSLYEIDEHNIDLDRRCRYGLIVHSLDEGTVSETSVDVTQVMTVRGPVEADRLGFTLPHEHVYVEVVREYRADGLLNDPEVMHAELQRFADAGGSTIVDLTTRGAGTMPDGTRDALALRRASEATGVQIVMGCGSYRDPYLDRDWFDRHTVDELADEMVHEIEEGVGGTGVKAGIIGEIGADREYISALEERSFRAAARAHRRTGLTITTHAARWPGIGLRQLDLLEEEGVDPRRIIIGHCDTVPSSSDRLEIARRGAYVELDCIRGESDFETDSRVRMVVELLEAGYRHQVLISTDLCLRSHLSVRGGPGYTFIRETFLPRLAAAGVEGEQLRELTIDNPRRALTGEEAR